MKTAVPNSPYGLRGRKAKLNSNSFRFRVQKLCESRGGRPLSTCGLYGRKATLNSNSFRFRAQELCESRGGRPWLSRP